MDSEVLIVGAGIAGAALASFLSSTHRVTLLEAEAQPGHHSTGRSAAMFMESYGTPNIRALTRASTRLATLAHAIRSTNPTAAMRMVSGCWYAPTAHVNPCAAGTICVCHVESRTPCSTIPRSSAASGAAACSAEIPGANRPMTSSQLSPRRVAKSGAIVRPASVTGTHS